MATYRFLWVLCCLVGASLALPALAPAEGNRDDQRRREADRLDDQIRDLNRKLDALRHDESQLHHQVDALKKQIPASRGEGAKADQASAALKQQMDGLQTGIDAAEAAVKKATAHLAEVIDAIEARQPSGSPLKTAKEAYLAAKSQYEQTVDAVQKSPEYQEAYRQAKEAANRLEALPAVRKQWLDENPKIVQALAALIAAKPAYETLRDSLLSGEPQWSAASKALSEARQKQTEAQQQGDAVARKLAAARKDAVQHRAQLKALEATLARHETDLKRLPGQRDSLERRLRDARQDRARLR